MKYLFVIMMLASTAQAGEVCESQDSQVVGQKIEDVNTDVPKGMRGAKIIVRQANGKETSVPIEKFKVVPRKQQFKVTERKLSKSTTCRINESSKNAIILGGRHDVTGLRTSTRNNADGSQSAAITTEKGAVLDLGYTIRNVIGNFGVGASLDTSGVPRANIQLDF